MEAARAWLVSLAQEQGLAGQVAHELPHGAVIGRAEHCTVCLSCPTISGEQCMLNHLGMGHFELQDCSSNGTFINGKLVGKGKAAALSDGDIVQLTKRADPTLQFRFRLLHDLAELQHRPKAPAAAVTGVIAAAEAQRAKVQKPQSEPVVELSLEVKSETVTQLGEARRTSTTTPTREGVGPMAPAAERSTGVASPVLPPAPRVADLALEATRSPSGVAGAELSDVKSRLEEERARVAQLTAEIAVVRGELSEMRSGDAGSLRPHFSADRVRAAEGEVLSEAEHLGLTRQRSVLEAELAGAQARHDRHAQEFTRAKELADVERSESRRLRAELWTTVERLARMAGEQEALRERAEEVRREADSAALQLGATKLLTGLEEQLQAAQESVQAARAAKQSVDSRAARRQETLSALRQKAERLSREIRLRASLLARAMESGSCTGLSEAALAPEPSEPSRGPATPAASTRPAAAARALLDITGKENVAPGSPPGDHGRSRSRRGSKGDAVEDEGKDRSTLAGRAHLAEAAATSWSSRTLGQRSPCEGARGPMSLEMPGNKRQRTGIGPSDAAYSVRGAHGHGSAPIIYEDLCSPEDR
mmetsp:Transcript_36633/g.80265  ORF Transcript_36633/g.80265 Transcript_36633/m.80265 type:complete len:593 (-) Transcript_36633:281-2059(-)